MNRIAAYRRILIAILLAGAALRIGIHLDFRANDPLFENPSHDSEMFLEWADRIAGGDLLGERPFFLNPLYPYFLAPLVGIAGPEPLLLIRVLQMLLGLGSVLLIAAAVRRLAGDAPALISAGFAAVYPVLLFYEQTVMIVSLAVFLNALALHLLARFAEKRTLRAVLLAGLALGFAVLARPNVGLFAVLLPIWFLSLAEPGRRLRFALSRGIVLAAGAAAVVLPVTIRNYLVGEERDFVLVTSSMGFNLYQSNNPEARKGGRMDSGDLFFRPGGLEESTVEIAEEALGRKLKPSEVSAWWRDRALSEFRTHPGPSLGFLGRKLLFFLQSPEYPSSYHYAAQCELSVLLKWIPVSFGLVTPLAILGMFLCLRRRPGARPFALLFLVYAVGFTIFFPLGHYRAPVLPAAFALAAVGLVAFLRPLIGQRDWRAFGRVAAVLTLCAAAVHLSGIVEAAGGDWPAGYEEADRYHPWNRGELLADHGHFDRAEKWFGRAKERGDPRWTMGMAGLAKRRGDLPGAAGYLHEVLRLFPDRAGSVSDDAVDLSHAEHPREGLALAEAAVRAQPENPFVHANLGEILDLMGRHPDALRAHEAAGRFGAPVWIVARQAFSLREMKRFEEARRRLENALVASPDHGLLNMELALCLLRLQPDDVDAIRSAVRRAAAAGLAIHPDLRRYR